MKVWNWLRGFMSRAIDKLSRNRILRSIWDILRNIVDCVLGIPSVFVKTGKLLLSGFLQSMLYIGKFFSEFVPKTVFSILSFVYSFFAVIKRNICKVNQQFDQALSNWANNRKKLHDKIDPETIKQRKHIKQLLRVFHISVPLFENTSSDIGFSAAIIICQFVSFFTTWGGASYYLNGMAAFLPGLIDAGLFTAILIQGTIIGLSKKRSKAKTSSQWLLLGIMTCISIFFSFIGTANITAPPYAKYESIYSEEVYPNVKNIISRATSEGNIGKLTTTAAPDRLAKIMNSNYIEVGEMLDNYPNNTAGDWATLIELHSEFKDDFSDYEVLLEKLKIDIDNEDNAKKIEALNTKYDKLMNTAGTVAASVRFEKPAEDENGNPTSKRVQFYTLKTSILKRLDSYYKLEKMKPLTSSDIIEGKTDIFDTEFQISSPQYTDVWSVIMTYVRRIKGTEAAVDNYSTITSNFYKVAQDYYTFFSPIFDDDGNDAEKKAVDAIEDAANKLQKVDNANIVQIRRLFSNEYKDLIVPLLIAIFFDGLTFLLALAGDNRLPARLRVKSNRDNNEAETALLEQVFFSMNDAFIKETISGNTDGEDYVKECENAVYNTINQIQEYLKFFSLSPETRQQGCAQKAEKEKLEQNIFLPLTTILLQRGYLVYLSKEEYKKYIEETQDGIIISSEDIPENGYYFLRNRAENYLRQSITGEAIFLRFMRKKDTSNKEGDQQ